MDTARYEARMHLDRSLIGAGAVLIGKISLRLASQLAPQENQRRSSGLGFDE